MVRAAAVRAATGVLEALPRTKISSSLGKLAFIKVHPLVLKPVIRAYCQLYGVDMRDVQVPVRGFRSFDEFFTRSLRPGARRVDGAKEVLTSPADGRIDAVGDVLLNSEFSVKGTSYRTAELLGDSELASAFHGGSFAIVYLSPRDYHRVHAAESGPVTAAYAIDGDAWPVNKLGHRCNPELLVQNRRMVVVQDTERWGKVATVFVGAFGVGYISLAFDQRRRTSNGQPLVAMERGQELGAFHLGSTIVLLTQKRAGFKVRSSDKVHVGEALCEVAGS